MKTYTIPSLLKSTECNPLNIIIKCADLNSQMRWYGLFQTKRKSENRDKNHIYDCFEFLV